MKRLFFAPILVLSFTLQLHADELSSAVTQLNQAENELLAVTTRLNAANPSSKWADLRTKVRELKDALAEEAATEKSDKTTMKYLEKDLGKTRAELTRYEQSLFSGNGDYVKAAKNVALAKKAYLKAKAHARFEGGTKVASASLPISPKSKPTGTEYEVADLYKEGPGINPHWDELIDRKLVIVGGKNPKAIKGTRIDVNNTLLESMIDTMDKVDQTVRPHRIHTHVSSRIYQKTFDQWSRWYQEDGNTQVFRLFKGEQHVRSLKNLKPGRIEAVKDVKNPAPGTWVQWQGTYTIIKPGRGAILQILVGENPETGQGGLWPVHIHQKPEGDIYMKRRRPKGDQDKSVLIAKNVIGKSVSVKVRFDGKTVYEVYRKIHGQDKDFVFVGAGTYNQHYGKKVKFRWGIYQGSAADEKIKEDCMLFVTGVKIDYLKAEPSGNPEANTGEAF